MNFADDEMLRLIWRLFLGVLLIGFAIKAIRRLLTEPRPSGDRIMWCFAWILGVGFAASAGILTAVWREHHFEAPGRVS